VPQIANHPFRNPVAPAQPPRSDKPCAAPPRDRVDRNVQNIRRLPRSDELACYLVERIAVLIAIAHCWYSSTSSDLRSLMVCRAIIYRRPSRSVGTLPRAHQLSSVRRLICSTWAASVIVRYGFVSKLVGRGASITCSTARTLKKLRTIYEMGREQTLPSLVEWGHVLKTGKGIE
jgi:hypothetical protein